MSLLKSSVNRPGPLEIEQTLQYFYKCNLDLTIWQAQKNDQRLIKTVKIDGIDTQNSLIEVVSSRAGDVNWAKAFSMNASLYGHCDFRNFLCQFRPHKVGGNFLLLHYPDNVIMDNKASENRRIRFISQSNRVIFSKTNSLYDYPLVDISCTGMAFSVPKSQGLRFGYADDEIQIRSIMANRYEAILKGNIVYLKDSNEDERFRIGVRFQKTIDINNIIEKSA